MIHKNILIIGHVQGVGFRFSTQRAAKNFGIKGYVKNMPDGSVYIEAEGNSEQLNQFINWCYQGPPHAYISNVEIEDAEIMNYEYFDIKF